MNNKQLARFNSLNERLDSIIEDMNALRGELEQEQPTNPALWQPVEGDKYWYTRGTGRAYGEVWNGDAYDIGRLNAGNIYHTEEEAKAATVRVTRKLRELEHEQGWSADWSDKDQKKFKSYWNDLQGELRVAYTLCTSIGPIEWHSSEEAWRHVIETMEADVKLMLGVK